MFIGIAGGQIGATGSAGPPINLLVTGDSWMDGFESALNANVPNLRQDNAATSAETLYGANQIMADLTARLASPTFTYNTVIVEGGGNDWRVDPTGFTLALWKSAYVTMIDQCFAAGIPNVCAVSAPPIGDVWYLPGNVWYDMVQLNTSIPAIWDEFDEWLEAYCTAVGAKFVNLNQLPFAQNQVPEVGMTSAAHPTSTGNTTLARYIFKPVLQAPTPLVTTTVTVTRARPNKSLLTVADMTNIDTLIDGIGSDWSNTVEIWLLNQADATAAGNALTGLKTGAVMLPRSGGAGTTVETVTHDSTSGAKGVALSTTEYLRTTIVPSGRTLAMGAVIQSLSSYIGNTFMGVEQSFGSNIFEVGFVSDTDIRGRGLTGSWSTSTTNPSTTSGKFIEMRMVQSGSDQIQSLYESGVVTAGPTTATYSGTVPTFEIALGGVNFGGTYSTTAVTKTIGAFAVTNGTHNALTYATAVEAATA